MTATILVIEDNPITRKMVRLTLSTEGYRVLEAPDGRSAVDQMSSGRPDLVLQDLLLPDMDGFELLERLRSMEGGRDVPILAFTGLVSKLEENRTLSAGFDGFLLKPVEPSRLVETLRKHLPGAAPARLARPGRGRRVIVADDEPVQRKLAVFRLEDAGFTVEAAVDGEDALEKIKAGPPDAVLTDVLMPRLDGFKLCWAVRSDPRLARVPVVLVSSKYVDEGDRQLGRSVGASAFVVRTPEMQESMDALLESLEHEPPLPEPRRRQEVEAEYLERLVRQLERQAALNTTLLEQQGLRAMSLTVLSATAEALSRRSDLKAALRDALYSCLDAAGLSTGAVYMSAADGGLRLEVQVGLVGGGRTRELPSLSDVEGLRAVIESGQPVIVPSNTMPDEVAGELLRRLNATSALAVQFGHAGAPAGILLVASHARDLGHGDWLPFARTLAAQFGQAVALAQAFDRTAASERRYRTLMERANDGVSVISPEGTILELNDRMEQVLGVPRGDVIGRHISEFPRADVSAAKAQQFGEVVARGGGNVDEVPFSRPDGTTILVDFSLSTMEIEGKPCVLAIGRDVTDRNRAAAELRESERRFSGMLANVELVSLMLDTEARITYCNDYLLRITGWAAAEVLGRNWFDLFVPPELAGLKGVFASLLADQPEAWHHENEIVTRSGGRRLIRWNNSVLRSSAGEVVGTASIGVDITDHKHTEDQLRHSQKMEAVGRLAGGVAHDFNNLLGVITGYGDLLQRDIGPSHPAFRRVEQILKAATRAAGLTRQLLAFSRKQVLQPTVLDLNAVVADVEKMLRRLIGEHIHLVTIFAGDLGRARADSGQMEQVIVNLAVNARDAMPQGGKLIIETANADLDEAHVRGHAGAASGPHVMLAVSDTGHGMSAEVLSHLFEPFFTTKELGKGTGLGLATVYGIVRQTGGHVTVSSEPDQGATFRVYLPRIEEHAEAVVPPVTAAPAPEGFETILLVEDEASLRVLIREILESVGYRVLEGATPEEALAAAGSHGAPIPLIVTDVVLPRMSGRALAEAVRSSRPETRVLYMSGYTDDAIGQHGVLDSGTHLLQKPFTSDALLRKVREVLDAAPDRGPAG